MNPTTRRFRSMIWLAAVPTAALAIAGAVAQPPDGPPENRPHGPADRLRATLDANGDHELDETEIENAAAALRSLDTDGNGRIDRHEFRPPMPPPREPGDRGGPEVGRGGEGFRPGGPPDDSPRPARPEGPPRGRPEGPPRDGAGPRPGRPGAGPSPERLVERAMSFDADGDGKLDREELGKFAEEMMSRMRAGMADRGRGEGPPRRGPADSE